MMQFLKLRPGMGRRSLLAGAGSLLASPAVVRAQGQSAGVALVIGNSKYSWEASLPNVRRDAPDIARRFQALGLQTELLQDIGRDDMRRAVDKFLQALKGVNFAAFYFAGHGVVWEKDTYLVPVDADLSTPNAVGNLIPVPPIRDGIGGAAHGLIVLDNCRNNPADGWRQREALDMAMGRGSQSRGVRPPRNTLMLFSTAPGRVALDGPAGENSPFAASLLRQLEGSSVDLQAMPTNLRRDLLIATQGRQVLWDRNVYEQPFLLTGKPEAAPRRAQGGWAKDPSKLIDLANAYAYAQQNGLPLPAGLIAHRPPSTSRDSQKVGAFKFTGAEKDAALVIVMSVEEQNTAELILASRVRGNASWRFVQGANSTDGIDVVPTDGGRRHVFTWKDANGGSLSIFPPQSGQQAGFTNTSFTRIDG